MRICLIAVNQDLKPDPAFLQNDVDFKETQKKLNPGIQEESKQGLNAVQKGSCLKNKNDNPINGVQRQEKTKKAGVSGVVVGWKDDSPLRKEASAIQSEGNINEHMQDLDEIKENPIETTLINVNNQNQQSKNPLLTNGTSQNHPNDNNPKDESIRKGNDRPNDEFESMVSKELLKMRKELEDLTKESMDLEKELGLKRNKMPIITEKMELKGMKGEFFAERKVFLEYIRRFKGSSTVLDGEFNGKILKFTVEKREDPVENENFIGNLALVLPKQTSIRVDEGKKVFEIDIMGDDVGNEYLSGVIKDLVGK